MKRAMWATAALLLLTAPFAFADSVKNFNITQTQIGFNLNDGSGGNLGFSFTSPSSSIAGFGGASCDYCSFQTSFAPGDSVNLSVGDIFYEGFTSVKLGGTTYGTETAVLFNSSLSAPTITLPAGGSFSITVPAVFDSQVSGNAGQDPNFINFNLHTPSNGKLTVSFSWDSDLERYTFSSGSFSATAPVPEPSTISLMVLGLSVVMGGLMRRRGLLCRMS
jgi:hypothetical protein